MSSRKIVFGLLLAGVLLTSCITYREQVMELDTQKGEITFEWIGLGSDKTLSDETGAYLDDWKELKRMVEADYSAAIGRSEYNPDLIKMVEHEIYPKGDDLCGRETLEITSPESYSSTLELLQALHNSSGASLDARFEEIDGWITMELPSHLKVVSTNGEIFQSDTSATISWPLDQKVFKYRIKNLRAASSVGFLAEYRAEFKAFD